MVNETKLSILAWHFVANTGLLRDGQRLEKRTYKHYGLLKLCFSGLHASIRALDALTYAPGAIACRVTMGSTIIHDDDKLVASERTVLWYADATKVLHTFACDEAERALAAVANPDPRSLAAIAVKRRWIDGKATNAELAAARDAVWAVAGDAVRAVAGDAARAAAWDAAWATAGATAWAAVRDAAWAAVGDAAGDAVRDAAGDAARAAAWNAAWAAARDAANKRLEAALAQLAPKSWEKPYA
jgi:hypothetical protein